MNRIARYWRWIQYLTNTTKTPVSTVFVNPTAVPGDIFIGIIKPLREDLQEDLRGGLRGAPLLPTLHRVQTLDTAHEPPQNQRLCTQRNRIPLLRVATGGFSFKISVHSNALSYLGCLGRAKEIASAKRVLPHRGPVAAGLSATCACSKAGP